MQSCAYLYFGAVGWAELQRLVAEMHDNSDNLTPPERQRRLARLQQQTMLALFDLVRKAQGPYQPCYFPACLPGL